ncbi:MAG: hypothetical protein HWD59_11160 [Coxiellaceae bacterium]|nr:MAG: hypothetical protein HWD59_11160 [Coxiellaceae bacterium]
MKKKIIKLLSIMTLAMTSTAGWASWNSCPSLDGLTWGGILTNTQNSVQHMPVLFTIESSHLVVGPPEPASFYSITGNIATDGTNADMSSASECEQKTGNNNQQMISISIYANNNFLYTNAPQGVVAGVNSMAVTLQANDGSYYSGTVTLQ